jgi:hypothetical protein
LEGCQEPENQTGYHAGIYDDVDDVAGRLLGDRRYAEEGQANRDFRAYHCKAVCDIANVPELEDKISIFLTEAKSFSMGAHGSTTYPHCHHHAMRSQILHKSASTGECATHGADRVHSVHELSENYPSIVPAKGFNNECTYIDS